MYKQGYVYIVSNNGSRPLYIGVTLNLIERVWQHQQGEVSGYCKKYNLSRLVYFEACESIHRAKWRKNQIRAWSRTWKLALVKSHNPDWHDLYRSISVDTPMIKSFLKQFD